VTQGCCQPVLQSSPEQCGVLFTKTSGALHWWWVTAHLCDQQISIGNIAARQGYCEHVLQSSPEQGGMHFTKSSGALHWWWVTAHQHEQQIFIGVFAPTQCML